MPALLPNVDPDGLLEFSVVFTDRSLNSMSKKFQGVMNDISATMKSVYNADGVVLVPGGGTFGMEAVHVNLQPIKMSWLCAMAGLVFAGHKFSRLETFQTARK